MPAGNPSGYKSPSKKMKAPDPLRRNARATDELKARLEARRKKAKAKK